MNKKFSTLVAALLLSASVGTFTATAVDASTTANGSAIAIGNKGYETGKAYLLQVSEDTYLGIEKMPNGKYKLVKSTTFESLSDWSKALWVVSVNDNNGANPIYTFVNKATQTVLAADLTAAISNSKEEQTEFNMELSGSITNWQSAPSYKVPEKSPIYANVGGDKIVYLKVDEAGSIYAVRTDANAEKTDALEIIPKKLSAYALTANDLNTMLGATTPQIDATQDSYFDLTFRPAVASLFSETKLQAVAVDQEALKYGSETDFVGGAYASLVEKEDGFKDKFNEYVVLKNPKGKYIVADTAYVAGTDNNANGLIKFATDDLYNVTNEKSRLREPGSYQFKFVYNVSDNTVDISIKNYIRKSKVEYGNKKETFPGETLTTVTTDLSGFYGQGITDNKYYTKKFVKDGSNWYNPTGYVATSKDQGGLVSSGDIELTRALLGESEYVTLGTPTDASVGTESNKLAIYVGAERIYTPKTVANGAYLLQVVDSKDASRIGKYVIDNLSGGLEVMEQAARQNFQHMPAAQWVVKSSGNVSTIVNREFENEYNSGIMYAIKDEADQAFFFGGDVVKFISVTDATNDKLGYKYVADKDLQETRFTFNYLHNLAMDKSINTINEKDSAVWVDKDGESMIFSLEKAMKSDDSYGYNADLKNVTKLTRRAYYIKVNDPSKLKNNNRYLRYDVNQKKYVVGHYPQAFLLKENNEVEGGDCYYTLVRPNIVTVGKKVAFTAEKVGDNYFFKADAVKDVNQYIMDGDESGFYIVNSGMVVNAAGVLEEGLVPGAYVLNAEYFDSKYNQAISKDEGSLLPILGYNATTTTIEGKQTVTYDDTNKYYSYKKTESDGKEYTYVLVWDILNAAPRSYASSKVSVDNNSLALVNGVLSDGSSSEVANSAFSVKQMEDLLYRHFATTDTVKIYRVNATEKEYLYEDASSKYSKDKDFNFLGVEDKGLTKKTAMFLDTAYVNRGTQMPQYMLALRPEIQKADTILCDATSHKHATKEEALACSHSKVTPAFKKGFYLVNLIDSVNVENERLQGTALNKYLLDNTRYVRLGFVEATHIGDSLIISNSVWTGDKRQITIADSTTYASKDTIDLSNNKHNPAVFSFRKVSIDNDNFLIESESWKDLNDNKTIDLITEHFAGDHAPKTGGWIKIQNGVPVIANGNYDEAAVEAEVFNIETNVKESPVSVEGADATVVTVIGGQGYVTVQNAQGEQVVVTTVLGKELANTIATSDNAQISVSATGVVFVTVDGETTKVIVK